MRGRYILFLSAALPLAACGEGKPYSTTSGVGLHYTVVIDGVEVGDRHKILPPEGKSIDVGSSLVFRYQTPCGPREVPMKVTQITKEEHSRRVDAEPAGDPPPPGETLVIVDARGGAKVDLEIGSARVLETSEIPGTREQAKAGAWYGRVLGLDCANTHTVKLAGADVGTLLGKPPAHPDVGKPGFEQIAWASPKKDACFLARYAAVETLRDGKSIHQSGDWQDVLLRGPGWLPFAPDAFMKEATDPKNPKALFEVPCPSPSPGEGKP